MYTVVASRILSRLMLVKAFENSILSRALCDGFFAGPCRFGQHGQLLRLPWGFPIPIGVGLGVAGWTPVRGGRCI